MHLQAHVALLHRKWNNVNSNGHEFVIQRSLAQMSKKKKKDKH